MKTPKQNKTKLSMSNYDQIEKCKTKIPQNDLTIEFKALVGENRRETESERERERKSEREVRVRVKERKKKCHVKISMCIFISAFYERSIREQYGHINPCV